MFARTVRCICPACGHETKLARAFLRTHEAELCAKPGEPPEIECHWCHEGLMAPIKYRFQSGETFRLPPEILRALRGRAKTPHL
jgi:hypothetical protein